jgi:Tol biopolymer transport system component
VLVVALAAVAALGAAVARAQVPPLPTDPRPARIVFQAEEDLYTIAADGSDRQRLTTGGGSDPAWSPDGRVIAFVRVFTARDAGGEEDAERSQIWVMAADGSGARPVTPDPREGVFEGAPDWSPDGERLAFTRLRFSERKGFLSSIHTIGAEGGEALTVAQLRSRFLGSIGDPAWSPDGATIAYTRTRLGDEAYFYPSLMAVGSEGGTPRLLTRDGAEPAWSPDGERIAYTGVADRHGSTCGSDQCSWNGEIYVMRADGSEKRRLTTSEASDSGPAWSRDGTRLAFASDRNYPAGEHPELYSMQPDGGCLTWLTNGTADIGLPSWEPGSNLTTDPGGCGAVPREPLLEADTEAPRSFTRFPVWWLGPRFGELLLTQADAAGGDVYFFYDDCASFEPAACPAPLQLSNSSACRGPVLSGAGQAPSRLTRHDGALVHRFLEPEAGTEVYLGPVRVNLYDRRRPEELAPVLDGLRRMDEDAPPPGGLPRAELPRTFWHALERTSALYRKLGTLSRVRARLGISRGAVQARLRLARRLDRLGDFGRLRCR